MTSEPTPVGVEDALDNLVNQFSDKMSFFRELVQNSLDAGSPEIEVWFEFQEGEGEEAEGIMIVHVDDFGDGMDRAIIDARLTRLFSSSKDGDLTKIGRFGIGFVSVFAIEPDAVCVDTSRAGENWRVLFQKDRSFLRIQRDEPVEGTKIQIIKGIARPEYEEFVHKAKDVLSYWCRHANAEIRFEGEPLNQPVDLDVGCKVRQEAEGTEIVVGYLNDNRQFQGFYNKGLTLTESEEGYWDRVAFKINSRYLEHTLTRDTVLRDDNFHKAMDMVEELVTEKLPGRLFEMLEEKVTAKESDSELAYLYRNAAWVLAERKRYPKELEKRVVFRSVKGGEITLKSFREARDKKRLFYDTVDSHLITAMEEEGHIVVKAAEGSPAFKALSAWHEGALLRANRVFCSPTPAKSDAEAKKWLPLRRALEMLMKAYGAKVSAVELAHFGYKGSSIKKLVAITQRELGELTRCEEVQTMDTSVFSRRRALVVNADHPTVKRLVAMAPHEPELAAYFLVKLFFLRGKLTTELDSVLVTHSLELRTARRA